MLTDGLERCGLLWCFYQTLILTAPIHCRASIAETLMQRHISTNLMKKQTHPDLRWTEGEHILIFWWTVSLSSLIISRSTSRFLCVELICSRSSSSCGSVCIWTDSCSFCRRCSASSRCLSSCIQTETANHHHRPQAWFYLEIFSLVERNVHLEAKFSLSIHFHITVS